MVEKNHHFVKPSDLSSLCDQSGARILDVRSYPEHQEKRLGLQHLQIALDDLNSKELELRGLKRDTPIVLLCQSGKRAERALEKLRAEGFKNLRIVEGGLQACEGGGLPCIRTQSTLSLERQVRIAAGSMVFIGALLTLLVHRLFILLPTFVGAGLIFAGISNWCGMALLLAKAPWNKRRAS